MTPLRADGHRTGADARAVQAAALVERARSGDRSAFALLHERFAPVVHGVLLARVPPHDAEDLVQEVFFSAWRALCAGTEVEHVGAWLCAIARNAAAGHWRRARPTEPLPPDDVADGRAAARTLESDEILAIVRELPDAYRETLALRLVEGLTGPQIAAVTGLTHDSVRVNLSRGMAQLRERLRRKGWS